MESLAEKEVEEESDEDGMKRDKCPTLTVTAEEYMRWCAQPITIFLLNIPDSFTVVGRFLNASVIRTRSFA